MTRIRREQEKLARIPATLPSSCPVEALAREHKALAELTGSAISVPDHIRKVAEARKDAIEGAACTLQAVSPGGAMFQIAIALGALLCTIPDQYEDGFTYSAENSAASAVSALYSVLSVLEAAAGQPRTEFGTAYFCGIDDPRQILTRAASKASA